MASIKAIEGRSVHQIQSGQVIVDLTSVVKELVENSLDAGATSIDIRFKSHGVDAIEVQDNGSGISRDDYKTLALKHYTSKLSTYDDLGSLNTFGFRGEAISSLCALSNLYVVTAQDGEAPKGTKLEFEPSGQLRSASVAATQKGTLVAVEELFCNLPVRRRELEKNIKREYGKAINVLNAYACASTGVRFSVSQQTGKGKKNLVFSTRNNLTTRENIANVYGAKTISALVSLDLALELQPSAPSSVLRDHVHEDSVNTRHIRVEGHISRPVHGEGRQAPDRQMFFVNSRPCGLPQVAKAFNEVYRSYNVTQSPFIFANFKMDTNAYDVNVSPDKRTIMLHDQQRLLDNLKDALVSLFEGQDQTVPTQQLPNSKLPAFKPLTFNAEASTYSQSTKRAEFISTPPSHQAERESSPAESEDLRDQSKYEDPSQKFSSAPMQSSSVTGTERQSDQLISRFAGRNVAERHEQDKEVDVIVGPSKEKQKLSRNFRRQSINGSASASLSKSRSGSESAPDEGSTASIEDEESIEYSQHEGRPQNPWSTSAARQTKNEPQAQSFAQSKEPHNPAQQGVMTVGPTMSRVVTGPMPKRRRLSQSPREGAYIDKSRSTELSGSLRAFAAPGTQINETGSEAELAASSFPPMKYVGRQSKLAFTPQQGDEGGSGDEDNAVASSDETASSASSEDNAGEDYAGEEEKRADEEARIQKMVEKAARSAERSSEENQKRAAKMLRRSGDKIFNLVQHHGLSLADVEKQQRWWHTMLQQSKPTPDEASVTQTPPTQVSPEERLSLTISKSDFAQMRIIGQFNLGFILAVRSSPDTNPQNTSTPSNELFIIDQHASDEIYNFHRLSASTTLTPQPLVRPHPLQLTAIEEETILDHKDASLAKNGFNIVVDTSGSKPVGERCNLVTLPTSKETVFDTRDLEELLVLLADVPAPSRPSPPLPDVDTTEHLEGVYSHRALSLSNTSSSIVRPSKVRRMLAMRACRSSIMIGKALTQTSMAKVVRHMGEIERPWNCPHGRPTMRHLSALDSLGGWEEWSGSWRGGDEGLATGFGMSNSTTAGRCLDEGDASVWREFLDMQTTAHEYVEGDESE